MKQLIAIIILSSLGFNSWAQDDKKDSSYETRLEQLKEEMSEKSAEMGKKGAEMQTLSLKMQEMAKALRALETAVKEDGQKTEEEEEAIEDLKDEMEDLGDEMEDLGDEMEDLGEEMGDIGKKLAKVSVSPRNVGDSTVISVGGVDIVIKGEDGEEKSVVIGGDKNLPNKKPKKLKKVKTRWIMLDVGLNNTLSEQDLTFESSPYELNQGRSWNVDLHLFRQRIGMFKNHLNLMYGLGVSFNHYNYTNHFLLSSNNPDGYAFGFIAPSPDLNYEKTKLRTTYLDAPLMVNINTNPRKSSRALKLSAGVYGGVLLGGKTKQITNEGKNTNRDDFGLNRFRYGVVGELALGPINLYAKYQLNQMFDTDGDPNYDLHPISIGISIIPF